jgi:hypothetical protein
MKGSRNQLAKLGVAINDLRVCFRGSNMEQRGTKSAPLYLNPEFIDDGVEIYTTKFDKLDASC